MNYGPVEMIVVSTPERHPSSSVVKTLRAITDRDQIRIIDVAFVHTDDTGTVWTSELADMPGDAYRRLAPIVSEVSGLIAEDDLLELGAGLGADRNAGVYLLEHRWARHFDSEVRRSGARVILHLRVPRAAVAEVAGVRADHAR
jgi:hypothetical protein